VGLVWFCAGLEEDLERFDGVVVYSYEYNYESSLFVLERC
jgi:hypothetical protein